MNHYSSLDKIIKAEIPLEFLTDFLKSLPTVYEDAYAIADAKYPKELARDIYPYLRKNNVDKLLIDTAKKHNIESTLAPNYSGSCSHACIKTNSIILTAHAVKTPNQMVRDARCRKTYARDSKQLWLLSEFKPIQSGDYYYLMLIHGEEEKDLSRVSFAQMVLPSHDYSGYLDRIDLETYCCKKMYKVVSVEEIQDTAEVKFRNDISINKNGTL